MRLFLILLLASASLLGSACVHSQTPYQGYCHRLKTEINAIPNNTLNQPRVTITNRSVLLQQYQTLGCETAS